MTRIISNALFMEVKNPKIQGMVSVTKMEVTQDLRYADVYFSVLSVGENKVDELMVLEGLNEIKKFLRKEFLKKLILGMYLRLEFIWMIQ